MLGIIEGAPHVLVGELSSDDVITLLYGVLGKKATL